MISMNTHQATALVGGTLIGKAIQFRGVCTDSRKDCKGKLFVALKGEKFNGADYVQQALANGAVAILATQSQDVSSAQIICEDSLEALTILAKNWAKQCATKIIAITGSNGKTTVKNMIYSILSVSNQCSATVGNLNNEIGVPLTLCNIHAQDKYAVIEMGAAKVGDISYLVSLVDIHTAALSSVSAAHIDSFGTFANIVHEKGQIVSTLNKDGFAVLPIDDENYYTLWTGNTIANVLSFGSDAKADVTIASIQHINLPVAGKHNLTNAACATAIAQSCKIASEDIKIGLEQFIPATGRLENLGKIAGNIVINDSYNANPQSAKAAIDVLSEYAHSTLVLGDMAELGADSHALHAEIGEYAHSQKITNLLTIGQDAKFASAAFTSNSQHFADILSLKNYLLEHWQESGTILIKGSRCMHLEDLVSALVNPEVAA
ncbi:MAG: UDP-N-acetylmuramoyl-tripeptide--D-alanyl-D-alanine ligase [Proteobacteria bacterium]|nr:UDP-N-acetylmuramoyl-tripeptide--D-alanyl-D-alanine ligase [Pseudomonadota bacterium]